MSQLTIFRASAGSGKTYRLVAEYIKLLIENPLKYRNILAVTFTNKATAEMKIKVISTLYSLSTEINDDLKRLLCDETNFNDKQIQENSSIALSLILHDYDRFSINTIDSFFQAVLRSFAKEMGSMGSYEVDLNQSEMLMEACERMISRIDQDKDLKEWLLMMAEEQMENNRSWELKNKIVSFGNEIGKDVFRKYIGVHNSLEEERGKLKKLKLKINSTIYWYENECKRIGREGLALIESFGLQTKDFKGGINSFINYFKYLKDIRIDKFKPNKTTLEVVNNIDNWYTKKSPKEEEIKKCYHSGLNSKLSEAITLYNNKYFDYSTAIEIKKNINQLGLMSTLAFDLRELQREKNMILLTESDKLLNVIINNNDAPFIYENFGAYFNHFMIDEFQDTSNLQWENFKPLVVNSLSENNSNLIVGDIKQSIYRWRNSEWQLLGNRIEEELKNFKIEKKNLATNWRSSRRIIEFNNDFFNVSKDLLQNSFNQIIQNEGSGKKSDKYSDTIRDVFSDIVQVSSKSEEKGYVKLQFIIEEKDNEDDLKYDDYVVSALIENICKVQDAGYKASDIAILVRKNSEGSKIANALLKKKEEGSEYNFDVISDDSMFLGNSVSVRFLIGMLRYILNPDDKVNRAAVIFEYSKGLLPLFESNESFGRVNNNELVDEFITDEISEKYFSFFTDVNHLYLKEISNLSLFDLVHLLEKDFNLNKLQSEQSPLQVFNDSIFDYTLKESESLHKFLEWWDIFGTKIPLQSAMHRDAIRIMTIHKSKGLEFPIVMIPYCNWEFGFSKNGNKEKIIWCPSPKTFDKDFPILPVKISKNLINTYFSDNYFVELLLSYIDNFNLLYVAFTRAVDGLFIFTERGVCKKDITISVVDDLLSEYLNSKEENKRGVKEIFEFGNLANKRFTKSELRNEILISRFPVEEIKTYNQLLLHKNYEHFLETENESRLNKINEGKIIHDLLSDIKYYRDLEISINKACSQGKIQKKESESYKTKLKEFISSETVKDWFDGTYKVMNEATIIDKEFGLLRPDRVMIKGEQLIIVDYKHTSERNISHVRQVRGYITKIMQMGFTNVRGYLWYLKDNTLEEVIKE
jgi:ATP-dependent exoDNAse (exonuclease V) beta subunit